MKHIDINFFNQIDLALNLKKIKKIVFFSSFNIFRKKKIRDIGYYISKKIMFELTKNDKKKNTPMLCYGQYFY